jgi:hypothetical protein
MFDVVSFLVLMLLDFQIEKLYENKKENRQRIYQSYQNLVVQFD